MTTFELDLSKSDSLIDDIQKIFKPPSVEPSGNSRFGKAYFKNLQYNQNNEISIKDCHTFSMAINFDENDKSLKNSNISWKKPKSNSHEYCDSCGTFEGERLVCDRCPASFHLECLDPPIDNEEAPVGVWYCNRCTAIMKEEDDKYSSVSTGSNARNDNESGNNGITNGCHGLSNTSKRSVHSSSSASSEITTEMLSDEIPNKKRKADNLTENKKLTALQNIQDVVQCLNPKEFELTKDLIPGIKLPNTFKTNAELKTKSVITLENGVIPRPIVACFECSRTCLYGSLIQCDYCPLYFHLDCLDPPLVQLPSRVERWMCPNHIEQVIDNAGIIKTIRLSERMKAYDDMQKSIGNIDELDLLSTFASGRGFRFGTKTDNNDTKTRQKVKVPDAVIRMYKFPLKTKTPNGTFSVDNAMLTEEQKSILTALLQTSCKDVDYQCKDVTLLLKNVLDSIRDLISTKNIDLFSDISPKYSVISKPGADQVKSRALLIPLSKDGSRQQNSISRMIYRNCDIGSSPDNDCVVTNCKYVSPRHASICYLDNHFSFELVNYSRYGTVVDDLLYYNDVSEKESHKSCHPNQNIRELRNFLGTNENPSRFNRKTVTNSMKSQRDMDKKIVSCTCSEYGFSNTGFNNCMGQGWESTAPLKFGSVIRIGCQSFIFTEVNHTLQPDAIDSVSPHHPSSISSDSHDSNGKVNPENTIPLKSPHEALPKQSIDIPPESLLDEQKNKKSLTNTPQSDIISSSNSLQQKTDDKIQSEYS